MNARVRFWSLTILLVLGAITLRGLWLTADPPEVSSLPRPIADVGVVWHDEGAWTHNARNHALHGVWRTDAWNPVFIAPVFTGLEYASFSLFGVGTWQARMVPLVSGVVAIIALMAGLWAVVGRNAALFGGVLLATNYTFVMWNRAALMESTMTAFIVVSWGAYALATRAASTRTESSAWAVLAGAAAVAAFFTKAAAAFFVAALVLEALTSWWLSRSTPPSPHPPISSSHAPIYPSPHLPILMGMAAAGAVALAILVVPYWAEFQFYNWEMTVTRKPSYGLGDFQNRVTYLLSHGAFSRMWLVLAAAVVATLATVSRWTTTAPAARLAVLWLMVGVLELVIHDSGNERRYVMFVPALIALAGMSVGRWGDVGIGRWGDEVMGKCVALVAVPLTYLVAGTLLRLVWIEEIRVNEYTKTVWTSATLAIAAGLFCWAYRARVQAWLSRWALGPVAAAVIVIVTCGTDLTLYGRWAQSRTFLNVEASRMLGGLLPPGTLVHGKLANGLSLENRIAPVFIGRGFGNYADRLERSDARYILSYTLPEPGYEGDVILDVLQHYPQRRVITEFDVQETPGPDRAALIQKLPDGPDPRARDK
jgi:hypothetical protein